MGEIEPRLDGFLVNSGARGGQQRGLRDTTAGLLMSTDCVLASAVLLCRASPPLTTAAQRSATGAFESMHRLVSECIYTVTARDDGAIRRHVMTAVGCVRSGDVSGRRDAFHHVPAGRLCCVQAVDGEARKAVPCCVVV